MSKRCDAPQPRPVSSPAPTRAFYSSPDGLISYLTQNTKPDRWTTDGPHVLRRDDDSVWLSSRAASLPKSLIAVEPHERGVLLPRRGPPSPRTALSPQSSARSLRPSHRCVAGPEPSSWFLGSQRGSGIFFGKPPEGRGRGARWPGIPSCDASSAGGGKSDGGRGRL